jgi:hypothetical protein
MKRTVLLICLLLTACLSVFWLYRPAAVQPVKRTSPQPPKPQVVQPPPKPRPEALQEPEVELATSQQATFDRWMRECRDWESLEENEEFSELHMATFQSLIRDTEWKHRLKQAASLARKAQGDESATPENTVVAFDFSRIFDSEDDRRRYAAALIAGDRRAVEELYIDRMWDIAAEQHFNPDAADQGGLTPIPMTDEIRERLRKDGR